MVATCHMAFDGGTWLLPIAYIPCGGHVVFHWDNSTVVYSVIVYIIQYVHAHIAHRTMNVVHSVRKMDAVYCFMCVTAAQQTLKHLLFSPDL